MERTSPWRRVHLRDDKGPEVETTLMGAWHVPSFHRTSQQARDGSEGTGPQNESLTRTLDVPVYDGLGGLFRSIFP